MRRLLLTAAVALGCWAQAPEQGHEAKAGESSHGGGHEEPPILYKWINFAILAGGIGYLIAKNAGPALAARAKHITNTIEGAARMKGDAESEVAEIIGKLGNLSAELDSLRAAARQEMETERQRFQEETRTLMAKFEQGAQTEIEVAARHARAELRKYSAELALKLAQEKVRARVNADVDGRLLDGFLADLHGAGSGSAFRGGN